jgi:ribosomal protein L40E
VVTSCPKCYADVEPGLKFCTECGTKITRTVSSDVVTSCPKCYADVEPGLKFCTECGTSLDIPDTSSSNINEKLRQRRAADGKDVPSEDDTIDNIVESGKGLMKGLGGFLNKTAESFDKKVDNSRQKQVIARKPKATDNNTNPGYLVCNSCGGYYQLEQGESPDDFEDVCDCGGKFMHKTEL